MTRRVGVELTLYTAFGRYLVRISFVVLSILRYVMAVVNSIPQSGTTTSFQILSNLSFKTHPTIWCYAASETDNCRRTNAARVNATSQLCQLHQDGTKKECDDELADIFVTSQPRDVSKGGSRGDVFIFSHISVGSIQFISKTWADISSEPKKHTFHVFRGRHVSYWQLGMSTCTEKGQTRASVRVQTLAVK